MHVGDDGGNCPFLAARQFGAPCGRIEILKNYLHHPLVDSPALHERLAKVVVNVSGWGGHYDPCARRSIT